MSSRRQRSIPLGGRYRQVSLYITSDLNSSHVFQKPLGDIEKYTVKRVTITVNMGYMKSGRVMLRNCKKKNTPVGDKAFPEEKQI